ncbi:MAG: A/G-specific adenine glycosylase [Cryobacterium sp.]|nr:A/G-specific adenine glycosylase [Cryobacterium sp.]
MGTVLAEEVSDWFRRSARDLPWRAEGFGAWGILVSEFMLQQTPVSRVIGPLNAWLQKWPTPQALASATAGDAVRAWGRLGYPRRALRLHACAVDIVANHGGVVPDDLHALLSLPGVGEYTARAVAVFAYRRRHPVVDTNVRRVIARTVKGQGQPGPSSTSRDLAAMEELLPSSAADAAVASAAFMELGAIVCTARSPQCDACPIAERCAWRTAGYPEYSGPVRAKQPRYEGSDRHVRGAILAELRASEFPVESAALRAAWPDERQWARALNGLVNDGLVEPDGLDRFRLPA